MFNLSPLNDRTWKLLIWIGLAFVLPSFAIGIYKGMGSSMDFQWSGTRLLWQGINPYEYQLRPVHPDIILQQNPAYGHLLYLLLWPYSVLSWHDAKAAWICTNLLFLTCGLILLYKSLRTEELRRYFIAAALLLCIGFTVRSVLTNGQQTLLMFVAIVMFMLFIERPVIAGIALAVLLTKYTFGLQMVLLALVLGYFRAVAIALGVTGLSILAFAILSHSGGSALLAGPLYVARVALNVGFGDLLSLGRRLSGGDPFTVLPLVGASALLNLGYFTFLAYRFRARRPRSPQTVALCIAGVIYLSMATVYHLKYDYLILFICLYAFIATEVLGPTTLLSVIVGHFLVYWLLLRDEALFASGRSGDILVVLMILSFLVQAFVATRFALRVTGAQATVTAPNMPHLIPADQR